MPIAARVSAVSKTDRATTVQPSPTVVDSPAGAPQAIEERAVTLRRGLRRMRTIATLLLVLMTAIFIAATVTKYEWPWLPYLRAFAEAGMVGACADWFAVVA